MTPVNDALAKGDVYKFKPYTLREPVRKSSNEIPRGRSGHSIASDNSCVYSFGGYNPIFLYDDDDDDRYTVDLVDGGELFKEFWKFNVARGEWKLLDHFGPSLPMERASNAMLMKGSSVIVHGGTGLPFGHVTTNETYIADMKESKPFELFRTRGRPPIPMYGQAMVLDGHRLYVFGGTTGDQFPSNIYCLDLKSRAWEEVYLSKGLPGEPPGRYRHELALYNSRIIVFGGGTRDVVFGFECLPAFNLETRKWESLQTRGDPNVSEGNGPSHPAPRRCHEGVQVPGDGSRDPAFVICGGYDGYHIFSDVWKFNLRTLQWTKCDVELVNPLYFHSTTLNPHGQMFVYGGVSSVPNPFISYDLRRKEIFSMWVIIPKLKEICWEALLYYNPSLTKCNKFQLLYAGVPNEFVERIQS